MKGRQRIATNSQMWRNLNDSNYDGKHMWRDCLWGTYEIASRLIFVERSVQNKCFVSEFSTYSLSLPSIGLDHDSNQVMKFVYIRSTCNAAVLNKGLQFELHLLKQLCVYSFELYFTCAEYVVETFGVRKDEDSWMAFHLNPNCIDVSLEKLLSTSDDIRIITNDLQLNCCEDVLKTWLNCNWRK